MSIEHPIHVAITRKIKVGCEEEFQAALRDFFKSSFAHTGVHGASMLVPPPGSASREYGIIRTFANNEDREAFYASPLFQEWKNRIASLTEGEPEYRQLHGLEAWFRNPEFPHPPQWKMAIATYLGVVPVIMFLASTLGRVTRNWNFLLNNLVFNAFVVALLTWVVMPLITRALRGWLNPNRK